MSFRKRCRTITLVYLAGSLLAWFLGPVPVFPFFLCGVLYVGLTFLFACLCLRDFRREMRRVCPQLYRNWANWMRETDFHPDRKRAILAQVKQEMRQSPRRTAQTQQILAEMGWCDTLPFLHFVLMTVVTVVMAANGKLY